MKSTKEIILLCFLFVPLLFALVISQDSSNPPSSRPNPKDAPRFARWLVRQSSWGVININAPKGVPFGNVMSFTDGGTGIPYFYMSFYDPTEVYAVNDPRSSFTLSEFALGSCGKSDPQNPTCAKITLSGMLKMLATNSKEAATAKAALFKMHPQFNEDFPKNNGSFSVFKLIIQDIFLVNEYAPAKNVSLDLYYGSSI